VICELASQALFANDLFIRPTAEELENFGDPDFTVIATPKFKANPERDGVNSTTAVMIDYEQNMVIITGTGYSGEIKKSVFSIMNFLMPKENVLPMHCSANMDPVNKNTALFFGLSGTGKTTLSADPKRMLIGDDEHGWSEEGIFNFEGGCYAKCINIDPVKEPDIYGAINAGALVENVILDKDGRPDYSDNSITNNTRVSYPINFIKNAAIPSIGGIPSTVIFLTADSFGVLPPISKLSKFAAMYHFVTGFTSKVAGTEEGIVKPVPTFSTLFGQPFMPLSPMVYAQMFGDKIEKYSTKVYMINTGWTGGPYGTGMRINLSFTRAMVRAVLSGEIEKADFVHDKTFNIEVPLSCPCVPNKILNPRNTWEDKAAYDAQAKSLADMFQNNSSKKYSYMSDDITSAGPKA
ncbi:MAG: phosphoenolpyruvate carboxykinase (ATP), partial [Eggerthellaceae bacterium]|nr:phosphoenolpyruvate carboxykinase (ATP) [Eggerthellaceae bacterium]